MDSIVSLGVYHPIHNGYFGKFSFFWKVLNDVSWNLGVSLTKSSGRDGVKKNIVGNQIVTLPSTKISAKFHGSYKSPLRQGESEIMKSNDETISRDAYASNSRSVANPPPLQENCRKSVRRVELCVVFGSV